ncbi:MAG TPA: acyl carrier protein [Vicinamibacterales bacterium]|jgi:acyl carrier protein|nr:acyl carrier protein [Vicinamibacterales bacterium]
MTDAEILERLNGVVSDTLDLDTVSLQPSTTAADVDGWDSLAHIQIIVAIERSFGIRLRVGEMASIANVGELVSRIATRLNAR